jgi:transcriptional regulator with XRE-family HTH domain
MSGILFTVERTFARVLQEALGSVGWTAYELSKQSGVARSALSLYLSGQRVPEPATIEQIAAALKVPSDEMQGLADAQRLGAERLARMARYAPEMFLPKQAPDPLDVIQPPLSDLERPVVRRILDLNGGTLEGLNLNDWELLGIDRLAYFKDRLMGLEHVSKTKRVKKAEEA